MAIDFDYAAARKAGYSDDQILQGLKSHGELDFDVDAALKQYSAGDILQGILPKQQAAAVKPAETSAFDRIKDVGISALKGAIAVPEAAVGLADIVTGGYAGKGAEALGFRPAEARAILNDQYSDAQKAANQNVADAKGFLPTVGAMVSNPSTVLQTGIESLPSMGAGGVVGRGALALAPKIGAVLAGAVGEGTVGAGQAAEQIRQANPDGTMSLGQSAAALGSGIGTGAFAAVGGRIAQKLGIADIDTALVQAGSPVGSTRGVVRRMLEGGVSEGVFEELPQSIQEQMWQNAAMDKPLLDGVPENAAQGLLAGGLFGGIAGGALHGKPHAPEVPGQPAAAPLLIGNTPDPFLSFPDGSVGRRSDAEAFINGLPEHEREAARARLFGGPDLTPQPVTPNDVLQAQSVDEAIATANRAVEQGSPEFQAQRNSDIDAAWMQHLTERATQRQTEFQAAEDQRRAAETPQLLNQVADQRVAQANALTGAQDFGLAVPNQMQTAMQEARNQQSARKAEQVSSQREAETGAAYGARDAETSAERQAQFDQADAARKNTDAIGATIQARQQETDLANSISADIGTPAAQPTAMQLAMQEAAAKRAKSAQPAPSGDSVAQARDILTAAGVTGNERMAALRSIRTGENTIEDLIDAHPPKAQEAANGQQVAGNNRSIGRDDGGRGDSAAARTGANQLGGLTADGSLSGNGGTNAYVDGGQAATDILRPDEPSVTKPALAKVSGRKIDADWTEFARESGTLGIGRDQMPQVKAEHRGALTQFLAARGIQHETTEVPAGELKPTQREFSTDKVQRARDYEGGDRSILVSSDNHILDGHHQWLAKLDSNEPVKVIRLDAPIRELLSEVHDFPSSQVADGAENRTGDDRRTEQREQDRRDALTKPIDQITDVAEANRLLSLTRDRLMTNERTGLQSFLAWKERTPAKYMASIDVDSLKWVNDNMGHPAGDKLLLAMADSLRAAGFKEDAYHISGDEFYVQGNNASALRTRLNLAADNLKGRRIDGNGLSYKGAGFSYGIAENETQAEDKLHEHKQSREDAGQRAARGERPDGVVQTGRADQDAGRKQGDAGEASGNGSGNEAQSERPAKSVDEKPLKSEAPASGGMTAADVNKATTTLRAKWLGFTKVNTVQSVKDIPAAVQERAQADSGTEGIYDPQTKTVYLIADNIASPARAAWVAAHEVSHAGLRMLHDKSINEALNIAGGNKYIKELAAAIQQDRGNVSDSVATEEALAELSAATETDDFAALEERYGVKVPAASRNGVIGAVARVYEAVKRFLASVTGKPLSAVSDADVRALIGQQQAAVEGRDAPDRQSSEQGIFASVKAAITSTLAFKRWFGDSKVVDEDGKPLVMYHGTTGSFDAFQENTRGVYFVSPSSEWISKFLVEESGVTAEGANVMPVYVAASNPFDYENKKHVNTVASNASLGSTAISQIKKGSWQRLEDRTLLAAIKKLGFDGLYVKEDGVKNLAVFNADQIKSVSGNNGNFDPNENSILKSRAPASPPEEVMPKWAEGQSDAIKAALRKSGVIYTEETFKQKVAKLKEGALKKLQYGILDQFAPIKDQLGRIPYVMARMAKNADGTLEALMLYGRPHLDSDGGMLVDTTKKGFIETMQTLNGEHDRFFSWMAGRRAEQLKKEGRENLFTNEDISALSSLNQGQMKDGTSREATYLRAQKDVAELNKSVLDIAEKSGLIDAESRKVWASDFYVPFYRVMDSKIGGPSIKSGLVNQKSIKQLKGGTNNLGDLTQNMLMNWSTLLTASAKNRAARATLEAAKGIGAATEADEYTIRQMGKAADTKAVSYMENGVNRWHIVEDEHLLAAVSALEFNGYNNDAMKAMQWFKNTLTKLVTVSPYFKVRNLIRDSLSVMAVSDINRNPFVNIKNGYSLMRDNDARAQMVAGGGIYRFGMTMEGNRAENIKRLIDSGISDDTILNTAEKMTAFTKKLWHAYEEVGDLSENVNRAALYQKLRNEGATHLEASFEARDLMDFGLSGAWAGVRALNQILPFFQARINGIRKLGVGYNDDPKRMMYVVGALALATIALSAAYKDDDDFKKRSDSDRNNYWWFKVGGVAYRIPRPFEIGAAASAIDNFSALFYDSKNTSVDRFTSQMSELINGQLAMNPIPQVFRPIIDVYANKDAFTGRPIESMAMQRLRPEDRYTSNTSELARLLSKSGAFVDPISLVAGTGVRQLSPVQIDSLIKGYFAGAGALAVAGADGLLHHTLIDRGAALPVPLKTLTGSFAEDLPSNSSRYVDMLYKTAQDVEQTYASYQNALKQGDIEKAQKIATEDRATIAKYHMIESLKKNESRIGQVIQRTMNDKNLTGEQKEETIRRLKAVQDKIARQLVAR